MKTIFPLFIALFLSIYTIGQTTDLVAGDIALLQLNPELGVDAETVKFVALTSLDVDTVIYFTTRGWNNTTGAFNATTAENTYTYTVTGTAVSCGQVVSITLMGGVNSNDLSSGDSILVYQGTVTSPTFLFGAHWSAVAGWDTSFADNATNSELPDGINGGTALTAGTSVAFLQLNSGKKADRKYNHQYKNASPLTGSKATILSNISDATNNWVGTPLSVDNGGLYANFTPTAFTSTVTFSGTAWSAAGDYFTATISSDYDTSLRGDFNTCTCVIDTGITLTVKTGDTATIEENITNNGTIDVEDGGSVVQTIPGTNTGTTYSVTRNTQILSAAYQYTLWSTPLASSTMTEVVSDATNYLSFNAGTQSYNFLTSAAAMTPGFGYFIQGSNGGSYPSTNTASFTGSVFNTGNIAVTLDFVGTAGAGDDDWNMVGNPYPSAIFADDFLDANSTTIGGTIYLWTHFTNTTSATTHDPDDYASYNLSGGVAAVNGGSTPTGYIASGQGFWVEAIAAGDVTFRNNARIGGANNADFFKSEIETTDEKDRVWLNLTSNEDFSQMLVGFFEEATDGIDRAYDGKYLNGGGDISLHSVLEDTPYVIQGRAALKSTEAVPLGFSTTKTGNLKIAIDHFEGKLKNSTINLWDNELKRLHNLKDGDYLFTIDATGNYSDRFVLLISTEQKVLGLEENPISDNTQLIVLQNPEQLELKMSNNKLISEVYIYDILGRELASTTSKGKSIKFNSKNLKPNKVIIIKALLETGKLFIVKQFKN